MLYPLKFRPILKPKLWGGDYLYKQLGKGDDATAAIGESWEVSTLPGDESEVSNGILAGNTLNELIEVYMGDLVGENVYEKFGLELPVLVKILDARLDLSIQVHPDEKYANKYFKAHGKTEMWYVLNADNDSKVIAGFNQNLTAHSLEEAIEKHQIMDLVNITDTANGDVIFMPPGRVHALGKGNVVVEIQSTSDITFRLYDYDRKDSEGNNRELHIKESLEVVDFKSNNDSKKTYKRQLNEFVNLVENKDFTANLLEFNKVLGRDYYFLDSFVILTCTAGAFDVSFNDGEYVEVNKGETVLLPASLREFFYTPKTKEAAFIETYYDKK